MLPCIPLMDVEGKTGSAATPVLVAVLMLSLLELEAGKEIQLARGRCYQRSHSFERESTPDLRQPASH